MKKSWVNARMFGITLLLAAGLACQADSKPDELKSGFLNPPDSARPWVYWFWLNGNITEEGITLDLEAMKRVGVGGVLIMEVDQGIPRGPIDFMSPEWRKLFQHVVSEASRLGLEVNMNNDAGWNGSGGPWIKPEESMQKVVWTETLVGGPKPFEGVLPQPETVAGFYQDISVLAFPACGSYRIENIALKSCLQTGFVPPGAYASVQEPGIDPSQIQDLTSKTDKTGRLVWDVPDGSWTILRFGHTITGARNTPSPETGCGWECDKLSKQGIEAQYNGMMKKLIEDVGSEAGKALITTHIDSWENGAQNWTAQMRQEFQARRGYDLLPYLPALTGRLVQNIEVSERFLWDLRQTVSDLLVENYSGHLRELVKSHGMKLSIEAYGGPVDDMPYAGSCDEPMGEFWVGGGALSTCKAMASAAHIYGKTIVGAESFTAGDQERWLDHPATIKSLGDRAFCEGINRFVFHRYALQPWKDRRPGMTMGPWGTHYERTQTWWENTPDWHTYLARCQHMLRQGLFVADICYLQPEAAPQGFQGHKRVGYDFDNCGADAVIRLMSVKDGRIVLPDGMSYRILVLSDGITMTPALARKLKELVQAGATVIGPAPQKSPSLSGYPSCDKEVSDLAQEIWGDCDGKTVKERNVGQGHVAWGIAPETLLASDGIPPDFRSQAGLGFIHRRVEDTDLYFVANPKPYDVKAMAGFRVQGKTAELWWPDSGKIEPALVRSEKDGSTFLWLELGPSGSVFVIFKEGQPREDVVLTLAHQGKPIASVAVPTKPIKVEKAVYGVQGDPQRSRDAKAEIQALVDAGQCKFSVKQLADTHDPAPMVPKALVVEYSVGDQRFTATGRDTETVRLSGEVPSITIEKAVYGILDDPKRTRDMRAMLQSLVDSGESTFEVAWLAHLEDPAINITKTAIIDYSIAGEHHRITGIDPETLDLLLPPAPEERVAMIRGDDKGKPILEAWQSGSYELTLGSGETRQVEVSAIPSPLEIQGSWEVSFDPAWGGPQRLSMSALSCWSKMEEVKYYSGTATYKKTFDLPKDLFGKSRRITLDLGEVGVMAHVTLNGKDLGLLWKPPFSVDVTEIAVPGSNSIEVKVTNLWVNRLIGDEQLPEDSLRRPDGTLQEWPTWLNEGKPSPTGRTCFTTWRLWTKEKPLQKSGLLGPVKLIASETLPL